MNKDINITHLQDAQIEGSLGTLCITHTNGKFKERTSLKFCCLDTDYSSLLKRLFSTLKTLVVSMEMITVRSVTNYTLFGMSMEGMSTNNRQNGIQLLA
jgi:hypothetical protein